MPLAHAHVHAATAVKHVAAAAGASAAVTYGNMSPTVGLGFGLALIGSISAAAGMNLMKASDVLERGLPFHRKRRMLLGVGMGVAINAALDTIAFALAPLSLMAPLAGVSIVTSVLLAVAGFGGIKEEVSWLQVFFIFVVLCGVTIASAFGPHPEADLDLSSTYDHFMEPRFFYFFMSAVTGLTLWFTVWFVPAFERIRPGRYSLATTIFGGIGAGVASAQTQMLLKVISTAIRAYLEAGTPFTKYPMVLVCAGMLPAFAASQLYLLNSTLASCEVSLSVPVYASSIILASVASGALFFHEFATASDFDLAVFSGGTALVVLGLSGLTRLRGKQQQSAALHHQLSTGAEQQGLVSAADSDGEQTFSVQSSDDGFDNPIPATPCSKSPWGKSPHVGGSGGVGRGRGGRAV